MSAEAAKAQANPNQPLNNSIAAHPPRATDAFYAKLMPALEVLLLHGLFCLTFDDTSKCWDAQPSNLQIAKYASIGPRNMFGRSVNLACIPTHLSRQITNMVLHQGMLLQLDAA